MTWISELAAQEKAAAAARDALQSATGPASTDSAPPSSADSGSRRSTREARLEQRRMASSIASMDTGGSVLQANVLGARKRQLRFRKSVIHDWGLYADEEIEPNSMVIEYVGEVVRKPVAEMREKRFLRAGFDSSYLFRVDDDIVIDASWSGSIARFMNHSCTPNAYAKIIDFPGADMANRKRIAIFASRKIDQGEEVVYGGLRSV